MTTDSISRKKILIEMIYSFPKTGRREELPDGNMYDYFIGSHRNAMLDIYGSPVKG